MGISEESRRKKVGYNTEYNKNNLQRIVIQPRNEERIKERISKAVENGSSTSVQAYIIEAVKARLESEGY